MNEWLLILVFVVCIEFGEDVKGWLGFLYKEIG